MNDMLSCREKVTIIILRHPVDCFIILHTVNILTDDKAKYRIDFALTFFTICDML